MAVNQTAFIPLKPLKSYLDRSGMDIAKNDSANFETMLTSRLGINGAVLGDGTGNSEHLLATSRESMGDIMGGGQAFGSLNMLDFSTLSTVSKLTKDPTMREQIASLNKEAVTSAPTNVYRGRVSGNVVRMAVNKTARHPDDLGRLQERVQGPKPEPGFTAEEESLLVAAAEAECQYERENSADAAMTTDDNDCIDAKIAALTGDERAGQLSAAYESNGSAGAIGYDRRGGTSYGKYQIASRPGTMDNFLNFLDEKDPELSSRLRNAGPTNTGSQRGRMPKVWKQIAAEQPERFEALQHEFIRETNYEPARKSIVLSSGVNIADKSYAVREVLWSTAVQHGPAGAEKIFSKALETAEHASADKFDETLIDEVYKIRQRQFGRHSRQVRMAVQSRLKNERVEALALLNTRALS